MMKKQRNLFVMGCVSVLLFAQLNSVGARADNGQWSEWSTTKYNDEKNYEVEQRISYRYRDKSSTTSPEDELDGWTRDDSKTKLNWSEWSQWQDGEVAEDDNTEVKTRNVYRFKDKKTTTSTSSTLSGWTKYDTKTTWGAWSGWTDTAIAGSSTRNVQTQQVQTRAGYTQYRYWRWTNGSWWWFCETCAKNDSKHRGPWRTECTPWMNTPITSYDTGQYCSHGYSYKNDGQKTYNYYNGSKKEHYYWQETQNVPASYKTQYRYQDATVTYYYYQWSDWSDWDTDKIESSDSRQVEDKTQYMYREEKPMYTYYRWSDWSDYNNVKPKEKKNREIEEQIEYRYREKQTTEQATTQQVTTQAATTQQASTQAPTTQVTNVTVGKVTIVPVDVQTEQENVIDSNVKQDSGKKGVQKGTILIGKNGTYKITNTKKKAVEYVAANKKAADAEVPSEVRFKKCDYKVTAIANNAFRNNKKLKSVKIGNNIRTIGNGAFQGCSKLQTVYVGNDVRSIGKKAFYKCRKLKEITIRSEKVSHVGKDAFKKIGKRPTIKIMRRMLSRYSKLFKHKM
ncbi:MAG TPA: hypothetical protein DHV96_10055 [Lachnospiraceae bacterium]|nr:hypothetical protein [Lachnospiraceae bacterium]